MPVAAALSARLRELDRRRPLHPQPAVQQTSAADPESALRELMVKHLPDALSMDTPERRARACALLAVVAGQRSGDLRFLDAVNVWFETVDGRWHADPAWQQVRVAYREALEAAIVRLDRGNATERMTPAPVEMLQRDAAASWTPCRVLVLADHWAGAWRILRELRGLHGVMVHTLICNNASHRSASFGLRQAVAACRSGVGGLLACVAALGRGRLHLRFRALHHETTLRWLQRERFWIGLHGMGVIYRDAVLAAFGRGILNAHIGLLPEFRGRSVMEWSILTGAPAGITVFFMDGGIDTGREIVVRRSFDVSRAGSAADAKASLFQRDGEMYRQALETLAAAGPQLEPVNQGGRRYFVMSRLLTAVVDELIESGAGETTWETEACLSLA